LRVFAGSNKSLFGDLGTRVNSGRFGCALAITSDDIPHQLGLSYPNLFGQNKALHRETVKSPLLQFMVADVFRLESASSRLGPRGLARRWWGKRHQLGPSSWRVFFRLLAGLVLLAFLACAQTMQIMVPGTA